MIRHVDAGYEEAVEFAEKNNEKDTDEVLAGCLMRALPWSETYFGRRPSLAITLSSAHET
jgi:hypothetical protein